MQNGNDLRTRLQQATRDVHERLHHHPGLAAVAAGTISVTDYRRLLERLWGFHAAFETLLADAAAQGLLVSELAERRRSHWLEQDLATLGVSRSGVEALPQCRTLRRPGSAAELLGALYVVEG